MPRTVTCLFCGTQGHRAKEHVFPAWLLRAVAADNEQVDLRHLSEQRQVVSARRHTLEAFQLGAVCAICNNGWLSQLEGEGRRILAGLWRGRRRMADVDCFGLALWSLKTACVLNAASNYRRIVPAEHAVAVMEFAPPAGLFVDVAFRRTREKVSWHQCQTLMIQAEVQDANRLLKQWQSHGYSISVAFADVMLRVVWLPFPGAVLEPAAGGKPRFSRIWPIRPRGFLSRSRPYAALEAFAVDAKARILRRSSLTRS